MNIDTNTTFFGTYKIKSNDINFILNMAYDVGYRHFDLAELYRNQKDVGLFLKNKKREDVFLTSKISFNIIKNGELCIIETIENTLKELQTNYIDLMLIHSPCENDIECWKIFTDYKKKGIFKNIGVSNYNLDRLQNFINCINYKNKNDNNDNKKYNDKIYCNQIEYNIHLYETQKNLIKFCKENNIIVSAYNIFHMSNDFNSTLLINFIRSSGVIPVIKSINKNHMISNLIIKNIKENIDDIKEYIKEKIYKSKYIKYH